MSLTRRAFVDRALKGSILTLSFSLGGTTLVLTPEQARAQNVPLKTLDAMQAQILEALGETMLPGAATLGLVHFIDHQLAEEDPNQCLLTAKYFAAPLPYRDFYAGGVKATMAMAQRTAGKPIAELDAGALESLVREMSKPGTVLEGFPVFLFYLCLRSDAVDVVYGTPAGFEKLNIPYMEHIRPPEGWNG